MAFGSMDMAGTGHININPIMNSVAVKRIVENSRMFRQNGRYSRFPIKESDIREFFEIANLFDSNGDTTMSY